MFFAIKYGVHDMTEEKEKPCCACKETRTIRDQCVLFKGEEHCHEEILKHLNCLRSKGFEI